MTRSEWIPRDWIRNEPNQNAKQPVFTFADVSNQPTVFENKKIYKSLASTEKPVIVELEKCAVCFGGFETNGPLSFHAHSKFRHLVHLDCLQTYLNSYNVCPLCKGPVENDLLLHYKSPSTALAAFLRKGEPIVCDEVLKDLVESKSFQFERFIAHFFAIITKANCDSSKLAKIIDLLPLCFDHDKPLAPQTFNFMYYLGKRTDYKLVLPSKNLTKMVHVCLVSKWGVDVQIEGLRMIASYLEDINFVSAEMWNLACNIGSPQLLLCLLPHTDPSLFLDGVPGPEIALKSGSCELMRLLIERNKSSVFETLKPYVLDPKCSALNLPMMNILIDLGFRPEDLFSVDLIIKDERLVINGLLSRGVWPLNYFVQDETENFKMLKEYLTRGNHASKLSIVLELCLVLLGILYCPEEKQWLLNCYLLRNLDPVQFNERIDFLSNPHITRHVVGVLTGLIQNSWASLETLSKELIASKKYFSRIYQFSICRYIPLLNQNWYKEAAVSKHSIFTIMNELSIPLKVEPKEKLKELIKSKDKDGIQEYIKSTEFIPYELDLAISFVALEGQYEISALLSSLKL